MTQSQLAAPTPHTHATLYPHSPGSPSNGDAGAVTGCDARADQQQAGERAAGRGGVAAGMARLLRVQLRGQCAGRRISSITERIAARIPVQPAAGADGAAAAAVARRHSGVEGRQAAEEAGRQ